MPDFKINVAGADFPIPNTGTGLRNTMQDPHLQAAFEVGYERGRASERQRIRQLAIDKRATYTEGQPVPDRPGHYIGTTHKFADLLDRDDNA